VTERDPLKRLRRVVETVEKNIHHLGPEAHSVRTVTNLIRECVPEAFRD
jgi:hypothetical protein